VAARGIGGHRFLQQDIVAKIRKRDGGLDVHPVLCGDDYSISKSGLCRKLLPVREDRVRWD
jgi:hypothetical protein